MKPFVLNIILSFIFISSVYGQGTIKWADIPELKNDFLILESNMKSTADKLVELEKVIAEADKFKLPKAEIQLILNTINALKSDLDKYDQKINDDFKKQIESLKDQIKQAQIVISDIKSKDVDKQASALAQEVSKRIEASIQKIEDLGEFKKNIDDLISDRDDWKSRYDQLDSKTKDLIQYYGKLPTTDEVQAIVNDNVKKQLDEQVTRLNEKHWYFGLGLMGVFGDRIQDGDYFVNADTMLIKQDVNKSTTLNFGLLLGYYLNKSKTISIQTSIPILSLISNPSSESSLTTFIKRTSGAFGIGISPSIFSKNPLKTDETLRKFHVVVMWNVASTLELTNGAKSIYLDSVRKFPANPGTNLVPTDDRYKEYFKNGINNSLAIGVIIRL